MAVANQSREHHTLRRCAPASRLRTALFASDIGVGDRVARHRAFAAVEKARGRRCSSSSVQISILARLLDAALYKLKLIFFFPLLIILGSFAAEGRRAGLRCGAAGLSHGAGESGGDHVAVSIDGPLAAAEDKGRVSLAAGSEIPERPSLSSEMIPERHVLQAAHAAALQRVLAEMAGKRFALPNQAAALDLRAAPGSSGGAVASVPRTLGTEQAVARSSARDEGDHASAGARGHAGGAALVVQVQNASSADAEKSSPAKAESSSLAAVETAAVENVSDETELSEACDDARDSSAVQLCMICLEALEEYDLEAGDPDAPPDGSRPGNDSRGGVRSCFRSASGSPFYRSQRRVLRTNATCRPSSGGIELEVLSHAEDNINNIWRCPMASANDAANRCRAQAHWEPCMRLWLQSRQRCLQCPAQLDAATGELNPNWSTKDRTGRNVGDSRCNEVRGWCLVLTLFSSFWVALVFLMHRGGDPRSQTGADDDDDWW